MRFNEICKGKALFLDDERFPANDGHDWIIVRSFDEAISHVSKHGLPNHVSFDHDLGEGKNGYDFVKWLVEQDLTESGKIIPEGFTYYTHSQNPIGVANINAYLQHYLGVKNG